MGRGLFFVFEGIDGSGTTTQTKSLARYIANLPDHNDILTTSEPWKRYEVEGKINSNKGLLKGGDEVREVYLEDRRSHQEELILPVLNSGGVVICDRHAMSTFAYQGAQQLSREKTRARHTGIIAPDITFLLNVRYNVARGRVESRGGGLEEFERTPFLIQEVIRKYQDLAVNPEKVFGKVITINGEEEIESVEARVREEFHKIYDPWASARNS